MVKMEQLIQSHPEFFDYLALIHNDLISERERFQPSLRQIQDALKLKHITSHSISNWLELVRLDYEQSLEKSWLLTDFIIEAVTASHSITKVASFDLLFNILILERRKKLSFFRDDLPLITQEQQDIGSSESVNLRKIKNYLQNIEEQVEQKLFNLATDRSEVRFLILRLITDLPLKPDFKYGKKEIRKYQALAETERLAKKRTLAEIEKLDKYLEYCGQLRKRAAHYLDDYLDKQLSRQSKEIITETKLERIMTDIKNLDEIRAKLITELKALGEFLSHKGKIDESREIEKELKKLEENTYQIAFIATMSAGKSSLINALLGYELLPSLEKSCTGRLTFINHHDAETVANITIRDNVLVVSYRDAKDLEKYLNKYLQSG